MSVFYDNNITNKGRYLFSLMQAGGQLKFTKIVMGSGYMPTGTTTRTITDVVIPFAEIEVNKINPRENGDFIVGGYFTNEELTQDEYFRELGIYAKVHLSEGGETEELLYSYGNAYDNAEIIPKYSTSTAVERQLDLIVYVGNDADVKVEVASGVYVTYDRLNEYLELKSDKPTVITGTLTSSQTSLTLENDAITTDSIIDIYADKWGVSPTSVNVTQGRIDMEFDSQSDDLNIRVEVR